MDTAFFAKSLPSKSSERVKGCKGELWCRAKSRGRVTMIDLHSLSSFFLHWQNPSVSVLSYPGIPEGFSRHHVRRQLWQFVFHKVPENNNIMMLLYTRAPRETHVGRERFRNQTFNNPKRPTPKWQIDSQLRLIRSFCYFNDPAFIKIHAYYTYAVVFLPYKKKKKNIVSHNHKYIFISKFELIGEHKIHRTLL